MSDIRHDLARAYFAAVTAGDLPDSLLTDDFSAWATTTGPISKETYQGMIHMLAKMCETPIRFTIDALTAEDDRVLAEAHSTARLIDGQDYAMTYVFSFRICGGRVAWVGEHYNALIAQEKLLPLMAKLG
jgi:ketosteroid isomerase-like protein